MGKKFAFSGEVDGFKMMDEGTYIFKVLEAKYDEMKDSVSVKVANQAGKTHVEFFNLVKNNGEVNEFQVKSIVRLCATALNDESLKFQPFDTDVLVDLVGAFFQADIVHDSYNDKERANIAPFSYASAEGFDSKDELDEL